MTEAGRSTTSPAAIRLAMWKSSTFIFPIAAFLSRSEVSVRTLSNTEHFCLIPFGFPVKDICPKRFRLHPACFTELAAANTLYSCRLTVHSDSFVSISSKFSCICILPITYRTPTPKFVVLMCPQISRRPHVSSHITCS